MKSVVRLVVFVGVALVTAVIPAAAQSDRSGFTFNIDLGLGLQSDTAIEESAVGFGGLNLGAGGWVTDTVAVMGRLSGTTASYDFGVFGDVRQSSGVVAPVVQVWPGAGRGYVEAGVGMGFWSVEGESANGLGLVLGAGFSVLNRGKHNLMVNVEYAPVFTDDPVHNFGVTIGYQLW